MRYLLLVASMLAFTSVPTSAADFWIELGLMPNGNGPPLHVEIFRANTLQECKNHAMTAYASIAGPIFCQHITRVELIDVYGNARPVE